MTRPMLSILRLRRHGSLALVPLLTLGFLLGGCQQVGVIGRPFDAPPKIDAMYTLPDRPTLVLVDDADSLLGNPALSRQIGATAVYHLRNHKSLKKVVFIEPQKVADHEIALGEKWPTTPITHVCRALGAEQVVYARVTKVNSLLGNGLYQPTMQMEVKVLAVDGTRLWPVDALSDPDKPVAGHSMVVDLGYKMRSTVAIGDTTPDDMARQLTEEAGLALSRLFYSWRMPEVGERL